MDPSTLDRVARMIGSGQSRRRVLKTLAGGALTAMVASASIGEASAAKKRSFGNVCAKDADCASNVCISQGRGKICGCGSPNECPAASDQCQIAACSAGICSTPAKTDGAACVPSLGASGSCAAGVCEEVCAPGSASISLSFTPSGNPNYCNVIVTLCHFTPSSSYPLTYASAGFGTGSAGTFVTDVNGQSGPARVFSYYNQSRSLDIFTGAVHSGFVAVSCPS